MVGTAPIIVKWRLFMARFVSFDALAFPTRSRFHIEALWASWAEIESSGTGAFSESKPSLGSSLPSVTDENDEERVG